MDSRLLAINRRLVAVHFPTRYWPFFSLRDFSFHAILQTQMRSHESLLGRLRNALGSKLNSGHRLSQQRSQFWQKAQQLGIQLGQVEDRIRVNAAPISADPEQRQNQRAECRQLEGKLADVREELDGLERMGSELIQSGGAKRIMIEDGEFVLYI